MKLSLRNVVIGILGFIVIVAVVFSFFNAGEDTAKIPFSDVVAAGQAGQLESIEVTGAQLDVTLRGDEVLYESRADHDSDVVQVLLLADVPVGGPNGVRVEYDKPATYGNLIGILIACLPIIVFPFVIYFGVKWGVREALKQRDAAAASSDPEL